jgi:hypothetical protein
MVFRGAKGDYLNPARPRDRCIRTSEMDVVKI